MSTSAIKAGSAFVELTLRNKMTAGLKSAAGTLKAFASGVQSVGQGLMQVGATVGGIGAAIVGPLAGAAKHFADAGSAIADMSARTGVATDHLSELVYAAEMGGAAAADLETALKMMAKNGMDPTRFDDVAQSIAAIEDPAERIVAALDAWGKSGVKLLPVLDSLQELRGEARSLGLSISPESAKRADELGDAMDRLTKVGKDFVYEVGSAIAEPLTRMLTLSTGIGVSIAEWVSRNQSLVVGLAAVGVAAIAAGAAIATMGAILATVATIIGGIVSVTTLLSGPIGLAVAGIAILTGGLVAAAAGWLAFTSAGNDAVSGTARAVNGITAAILSGNIENAWQQMAIAIEYAWAAAMAKVKAALFTTAAEMVSKFKVISDAALIYLRLVEKGVGFGHRPDSGLGIMVDSLDEASSTMGALVTVFDAAAAAVHGNTNPALEAMADRIRKLRMEIETLNEMKTLGESEQQWVRFNIPKDAIESVAEKSFDMLGGARGTFNAAAAGMLNRSGGPVVTEAKKQTGILEKIKDKLGEIDEGIEDLEGFSFE